MSFAELVQMNKEEICSLLNSIIQHQSHIYLVVIARVFDTEISPVLVPSTPN